jgi:CheY-like chemotaxis protein
MDLSLPVLDGCQATRQLKSDPRTRNLPVIALTAQSHPTPQSLRGMGFDDVIIKPCLPDELAEKVRRAAASRGRLEPVS